VVGREYGNHQNMILFEKNFGRVLHYVQGVALCCNGLEVWRRPVTIYCLKARTTHFIVLAFYISFFLYLDYFLGHVCMPTNYMSVFLFAMLRFSFMHHGINLDHHKLVEYPFLFFFLCKSDNTTLWIGPHDGKALSHIFNVETRLYHQCALGLKFS
jgi:hypothetical protein